MNKKAQFYILTALLLIIPTYSLIMSKAITTKSTTNTDVIYDNYISEAKATINNALYSNEDVDLSMRDFTTEFIDYSKTRNINLKVLYIIRDDKALKVTNFLGSNAVIKGYNSTISDKETKTLNPEYSIEIEYEENNYNYSFNGRGIEFKALLVR